MVVSDPENATGECVENSKAKNDKHVRWRVEVDDDEFCDKTDLEIVMI